MPSSDTVSVPIETAKAVTDTVLRKRGHGAADAALIADMLLWAQMRGNNQSLVKVPTGGMDPTEGASAPTVEHESKLGIKINGNRCPGIVGLSLVTDHVLRKVAEHGMALGALHGTCTGTGPIGYYCRRIAEAGFIGLVMCQSSELMAPYGGYKALYGTNPLAYGIPRKKQRKSSDAEGAASTVSSPPPIVFDAAMSGMAFFGLHELRAAGKPVPPGLAYDADGNETADPVAALAGALRTFDNGPKGSHLAMMVELLGGALAGGDVEEKRARRNWGTTVLAIDPDILGGGAAFLDSVEAFVARYKAQPTLADKKKREAAEKAKEGDGADTVATGTAVGNGEEKREKEQTYLSLPSERSEAIFEASLAKGSVDVIASVWADMLKLAEQ